MSQEPSKATEKKDDFESKHEQELGFKRFAYIQGLYMIVPLLTGAAGFLLGYATLGKPIMNKLPTLSGIANSAESLARNIKGMTTEKAAEAIQHLNSGKSFKEAMAAIGMELKEIPTTAKLVGGAILGFPAMVAGGVAVGYDKWRKDESARLAADEVNHDIAKLELFKPSDPELVAENKRLRAMLADAPKAQTHSAEHQGKLHHTHEKELA